MTARPLPYSLEAEESLLSICIQDGLPTLNKCMEARLTPGSFYDSKHGTVFARLLGMLADNKPIAIDTLAEDMKEARVLDHVGGYAFLAQVSGRMPTSAQAAYFIEKVADYARLRAVIRNGTELVEAAHNWTGDWDAVKAKAEGAMEVFSEGDTAQSMQEASAEALQAAEAMISGQVDKDAINWPTPAMNRCFGPIRKHELVVVGARPATGKTSLLLQIIGQAIADKRRVVHWSLETSTIQTLHQLCGQRCEVDLRNLHMAEAAKKERFLNALRHVGTGEHFRTFDRDMTIQSIEARGRALKESWKPDLCTIDYLQLIGGSHGKSSYEKTTEVANRLVEFRKAMGCPVIVACQLNRGVENEDREPRCSDARDSGAIEQAAHRMALIFRPKTDFDGVPQIGAEVGQRSCYHGYLLLAKNREGPISSIRSRFMSSTARFADF